MSATLTIEEIANLPPEEMTQAYIEMTPGQRAEFMRIAQPLESPKTTPYIPKPRGGQRKVFNGKMMITRVNDKFLDRLTALAKEKGKSREDLVRDLLDKFVEENGAGAGLPTAAGLDRTQVR